MERNSRVDVNLLTVNRSTLGSNHGGAVSSTPLQSEYGCARCSVKFPTKSHVISHMAAVHNLLQYIAERPKFSFECPTCGAVQFSSLTKLNVHLRVHQQGKFHCTNCHKIYRSSRSLGKHLLRKHGIIRLEKFKCEECDGVFPHRRALTYHSARHKPPQFSCSECDRKFFGWTALQRHAKFAHLGQKRTKSSTIIYEFPCQQCQQKFASAASLAAHLRCLHKPKDHKCSKCYMEFPIATALNNHMLRAHSLFVEPDLKCKICHTVFKDQGCLTYHSRFHGKPAHSCLQCSLKYYAPNHLTRHVKLIHSVKFSMPEKGVRKDINYTCAICCRPFGCTRTPLQLHLKLHYYKPQLCSICQHTFTTDEAHREHMRKCHPDAREMFRCDICNKSFPGRNGYLMHRIYHEKPTISCPDCPLLFYDKMTLQSHSAIHNCSTKYLFCDKGKRFGCAICSRKFAGRCLLIPHLNAHNPTTFCCSKCDFLCYLKATITKHLRNFH